MKLYLRITFFILFGILFTYLGYRANELFFRHDWGDEIDSLDGVAVFYNGKVSASNGRTVIDSYNVGLKYQCVEFVKRYYLIHYNHKMPNSYGHAKDFFQLGLNDGELNRSRDLVQYSNPSISMPKKGDLIVMGAGSEKYGHIAIISAVGDDFVEIIQQNAGIGQSSRGKIKLIKENGKYRINNNRINGWLRKN